MAHPQHPSLEDARNLCTALRRLSVVSAPPSLLQSVLQHARNPDRYAPLDTPIGTLFVAYSDDGVSAVERATSEAAFEQHFQERFGRPVERVTQLPPLLSHAVLDHLAGEPAARLRFDLRDVSPFERAVLLKALEIPRGEVRPYAWIAREIGRPRAVRAVGSALADNPIPILIPCHRVVRTDGRIGNYVFGSELKRAVLTVEGAAPEVIESLARAGVRYFGFGESHTYCLPTCGGEHLRNEPDRILFRSQQAAVAAGFRPCTDCRPV